jgi:hypothetical protein
MANLSAASLAAGVQIAAQNNNSGSAFQNQVIVNSGVGVAGSDQLTPVCNIGASNPIGINLLKVMACDGNQFTYTFQNNFADTPVACIWFGPAYDTTALQGSDLYPSLTNGIAWANELGDVLETTLPYQFNVTRLRSDNLTFGHDGAVFCKVSQQVNTTGANAAANIATINDGWTVFSVPVNVQDSINKVELDPDFCDCCFSANNTGNMTKCYDMPFAVSARQGFYFVLQGTATIQVKLDLCALSVPNNQMIEGAVSGSAFNL